MHHVFQLGTKHVISVLQVLFSIAEPTALPVERGFRCMNEYRLNMV